MTQTETTTSEDTVRPNSAVIFGGLSYRVSKPTVIIGHPYMGRGGSEARVMWLIEALKQDFDVTVVTTGGWDLMCSTIIMVRRIGDHDFNLRIAPVPFLAHRFSAAALRSSCYQRFAQRIAKNIDVRISAYNLTDWGCLPFTLSQTSAGIRNYVRGFTHHLQG